MKGYAPFYCSNCLPEIILFEKNLSLYLGWSSWKKKKLLKNPPRLWFRYSLKCYLKTFPALIILENCILFPKSTLVICNFLRRRLSPSFYYSSFINFFLPFFPLPSFFFTTFFPVNLFIANIFCSLRLSFKSLLPPLSLI